MFAVGLAQAPTDTQELLTTCSCLPRLHARPPSLRSAVPYAALLPCCCCFFPADYHPSQGWRPLPHHLSKQDLWQRIRQEAKADADAEPTLASFLYSSILGHSSFEKSLNFILANKLASPTLYSTQLVKIIEDCFKEEPSIVDAALADMQACFDRDPACDKYTQCLLYFKGFQAIQCHRIAHHLWGKGRKVSTAAVCLFVGWWYAAVLPVAGLQEQAQAVILGGHACMR
jgi:hypothetical protein